MQSSFKISFLILLLSALSISVSAAEQTWTGKISDSMCGGSHAKMIAAHGGTDRSCTLACVKAGGKYVFVSGGTVYQIQNQDFADLEKDAGRTVKLTGEMNGDTVTISKMTRPKAKASS